MLEHRYRENVIHGAVHFPYHVYNVRISQENRQILPLHWHDEMEIIYLGYGKARFRVDDRDYLLSPGDCLIVHSGELHSGYNETMEEVRYVGIVFKLSWLSSVSPDICHSYLKPIIRGERRFPSLIARTDESLAPILSHVHRLLDWNESMPPGNEMRIKGQLYFLLSDLLPHLVDSARDDTQSPIAAMRRQQIRTLLEYIDLHYSSPLDLNLLADQVSMSRSHFCRFFKAHTGMRPMEYVNLVRINQAANLLQTSDRNIIHIAIDTGFQHLGYFAKLFKAHYGVTPSEFRKQEST